MNTTIGDVANIILPFTSSMQVYTRGIFPCIYASITNGSCTKLFLYVKQVDRNQYLAVTTDDVYNGNKMIATDMIDPPFIEEKYFLSGDIQPTGDSIMSLDQFKIWFFNLLYNSKIIIFNPDNWKTRLVDMGFNSLKIRKYLDRNMKDIKGGRGFIIDLISAVNGRGYKFSLKGLEDKEIRCIYAKLRNLGLEASIVDKVIVKIEYERRISHE